MEYFSVKLKAKPCVHVEDIFIKPILLDSNENGQLDIKVKISMTKGNDIRVTALLKDKSTVCWSRDIPMNYCENSTHIV